MNLRIRFLFLFFGRFGSSLLCLKNYASKGNEDFLAIPQRNETLKYRYFGMHIAPLLTNAVLHNNR